MFPGCHACFGCSNRKAVKMRLGDESPTNGCIDCCLHEFCACCMLSQELRACNSHRIQQRRNNSGGGKGNNNGNVNQNTNNITITMAPPQPAA